MAPHVPFRISVRSDSSADDGNGLPAKEAIGRTDRESEHWQCWTELKPIPLGCRARAISICAIEGGSVVAAARHSQPDNAAVTLRRMR